jgi:competence CoiA-like predicted nuclease
MSTNTKPTIEEVLDLETGEIVMSAVFFNRSFDLVTQARGEQEKANQHLQNGWLVCAVCGKNVRILGGKDSQTLARSKNFHFAHLHNSDDCPIKTTSKYSKQDINRMKYRGVPESRLHIELKEQIAKGLRLNQHNKGQVTSVNVEQVIRSLDEVNWKKPDINAVFNQKKIAIELQLSTTWLDVIVSRQHFYKEQGIFILWIFNIFEASDDFRKLTQSDIIYSNNYNAFVLDPDAIKKINDNQDLVLQCYYLHYYADKAKLRSKWLHVVVTLDQLIFDPLKLQVYYHDVKKEKAAAEKTVAAYIAAETARETEEREERNRLRSEKNYMERQVRAIGKEIKELEEEQSNLARNGTTIGKELSAVALKLEQIAEKTTDIYSRLASPSWFNIPGAVMEVVDAYGKRLKAIKAYITDDESERSLTESKLKNINACEQKTVNNRLYHIIDKIKKWDYILENYETMYSFRTDQVVNLFCSPKLEPLNKLQIEQLRRNAQVLFLADFSDKIKSYEAEIIRLSRRRSKLDGFIDHDKEKFFIAVSQSLTNIYRQEETKLLEDLHRNNLELAENQQVIDDKLKESKELNEKIEELYYVDYSDDD